MHRIHKMVPKFPSNIIKEHSEKLTELLFIQQTSWQFNSVWSKHHYCMLHYTFKIVVSSLARFLSRDDDEWRVRAPERDERRSDKNNLCDGQTNMILCSLR